MKFSFVSLLSFQPRLLVINRVVFAVLLSSLVATLAVAQDKRSVQKSLLYQSLMIGGGLKICSSSTPEYCVKNQSNEFQDKQQLAVYSLSKKSFEPVIKTSGYEQLDPTRQMRLRQVFEHFYANPVNVNSPEELRQSFKGTTNEFDAGQLFNNLPNEVYYAILDYAQQPSSQLRYVDFEKTQSSATQNILRKFIQQANLRKPQDETLTISYITAAARNPFSEVAYYQQLLTQAAQEDTGNQRVNIVWLPLDQSLMQALEDKQKGLNSCNLLDTYRQKNHLFNADLRYPELTAKQRVLCHQPEQLLAILNNSHGLFVSDSITGESSSVRLLSLFRNSQNHLTTYQQTIIKQHKNGQLFVAGSGTGAAIMAGGIFESRPVPIMTGGTSDVALVRGAFPLPPAPFGCEKDGNCPYGLLEDDLTYDSRGGLGIFDLGIIDTDFSEQSRQARLAVLAAASKIRLGFGVDANTALLYRNTSDNKQMKVIGENGVFIADMRDAIVKTQSGKHQIIGMSHYVNNNDQIIWSDSDKEIIIVPTKHSEKLTNKTLILPRGKGEFRRNVSINCGTHSFHRWTETGIAWLVNPTEETKFFRNQTGESENCSYHNLLFGIEN